MTVGRGSFEDPDAGRAAPQDGAGTRLPAPEAVPGQAAERVPATPGDDEFGRATRPEAGGAGRTATVPPPSRMGGVWVAAVVAALILLFLLIFILQNGQPVQVSFLGLEGQVPLGVALLLAAACGVLLVAIPGTGRILQLRRQARRAAEPATPAAPKGRWGRGR
jgi:uncharacterized integral membrane protein